MEKIIRLKDLGIKPGEVLFFKDSGNPFKVISDKDGNASNCVEYLYNNQIKQISLRGVTAIFLRNNYNKNIDIFELWMYKSRSLKSIYKDMCDKDKHSEK